MKNNGDIVEFIKQKDYVMVNNNLGSGAFGQTVLLKDPFIDELFVAKKYEPYFKESKKEFYDLFLQEIKIMYKLNHPNVVRIFNYYPFEQSFTGYIIMEYVDGKNLAQYFDGPLDWEAIPDPDSVFIQLINGFDYIEKQGIVHRDIREGNIMVTNDGTVKIIDFGLGKTFSPVDKSYDSMVEIINRSGLDCLPNEYFEGKYDSRTDMFYLAELYNRILKKTDMEFLFSYEAILNKMLEPAKEKRFASFSDIKEAIVTKDFSMLEINESDKKIYQDFSNAILDCLSCFKGERVFVANTHEFYDNLKNSIQKNCFEDVVQNPKDIVSIVVKGNYKYFTNMKISCTILIAFEKWFSALSNESKQLVLNNIIAKISMIKIEEPDYELPF